MAIATAAELQPVAVRQPAPTTLAWPCRPLRQAAGGRAHRGRQPPSRSAAAAAALSADIALQADRQGSNACYLKAQERGCTMQAKSVRRRRHVRGRGGPARPRRATLD